MSRTVLYMSMSLDGFVAGPNAGIGNGLGDGGDRLHDWAFPAPQELDEASRGPATVDRSGANGEVFAEMMATGAVVCGRGTIEPAGFWGGDHHEGVPIFVLSRSASDEERARWPLVSYVDDVVEAMARAKAAAGDRDVMVHGATVAQLALAAGVLDELEIHLVPVLLGAGRRLFEQHEGAQVELRCTRVLAGDAVTHLHYRVLR
jgi:dihydrofolate reductase